MPAARGALRAAIWKAALSREPILEDMTYSEKARWLYAIAYVESRGHWNGTVEELTYLEGKYEEIGAFQIRWPAMMDICRLGPEKVALGQRGTAFWMGTCFDLTAQARGAMVYVSGYAGQRSTFEDEMAYFRHLASIHHGGPDGESGDMAEYLRIFTEGLEEARKVFK